MRNYLVTFVRAFVIGFVVSFVINFINAVRRPPVVELRTPMSTWRRF